MRTTVTIYIDHHAEQKKPGTESVLGDSVPMGHCHPQKGAASPGQAAGGAGLWSRCGRGY